jgi:hypothetical protein
VAHLVEHRGGAPGPRNRQHQGEQRDRDRHDPVGEAHQPPDRGEINLGLLQANLALSGGLGGCFVYAVLRCRRQVIYSRKVTPRVPEDGLSIAGWHA